MILDLINILTQNFKKVNIWEKSKKIFIVGLSFKVKNAVFHSKSQNNNDEGCHCYLNLLYDNPIELKDVFSYVICG